MSKSTIRASADLQRLLNEGYELEIRSGYLLIHHVPYVTPGRTVSFGSLISTLQLAGDGTVPPDQHEAHFIGEVPCDVDGEPLEKIINSSGRQELAPSLIADHYFSSKPTTNGGRYADYWDKMTAYISILSAPAQVVDPTATARTYPLLTDEEDGYSIFRYTETASSRAGIVVASEKLQVGPVGIVGLGGTGSYILDFIAKTPVSEIHLFDADRFAQHNAFRAPGAASREALAEKPQKVDYLKAQYDPMRGGIIAHGEFLDASNLALLDPMSFVFLSLDESESKRVIVDYLESRGISFIDVGMGVQVVDHSLRGQLQTTLSTPGARAHFRKRVSLEDPGLANDYDQNIQIAELNALNAALAVVRWKKTTGFYAADRAEGTSIYLIQSNELLNEDHL